MVRMTFFDTHSQNTGKTKTLTAMPFSKVILNMKTDTH